MRVLSPLPPSESPGKRLAALAVELLSPVEQGVGKWDLRAGARRAIELRLAGIFRLGMSATTNLRASSSPDGAELIRAERRELADDLSSSKRVREILRALHTAGVCPVVLKGRSVAERLWPAPWMRPTGDLDLLVDEPSLARVLPALLRMGLRPCNGDAAGRWRPTLAGVDLASTATEAAVDLHTRLFRSVGSGIDTVGVLSRTRESELLGESVRLLDPADEVLFLVVHAAAHGIVHPKWLLDLHAAAIGYSSDIWHTAAERARTSRTTRPFWAAARLLSGAEAGTPRRVADRLRPPFYVRSILGRLVVARFGVPRSMPSRLRCYALVGVLEERRRERVVRLAGLVERLVGVFVQRLDRGDDRPSSATVASQRWIEAAWRQGRLGPVWLTVRGGSMAPAVRDGDRVLAAPFASVESPRTGEIVIVKRAGRLIAHRLVAQSPQEVMTRGDACVHDDPPLPRQSILARVVAVDPLSIESR